MELLDNTKKYWISELFIKKVKIGNSSKNIRRDEM